MQEIEKIVEKASDFLSSTMNENTPFQNASVVGRAFNVLVVVGYLALWQRLTCLSALFISSIWECCSRDPIYGPDDALFSWAWRRRIYLLRWHGIGWIGKPVREVRSTRQLTQLRERISWSIMLYKQKKGNGNESFNLPSSTEENQEWTLSKYGVRILTGFFPL